MKQLSTILFVLCSLTLLSLNIKAQTNKQDSLALVDLYNSTGGPNWTKHTNWLTTTPLSTWYGVTLDANSRVYKIVLSKNNLSGTLPSSLEKLTSLTYLDCKTNALVGSIPYSFGNLSNLQTLYLTANKLNSSIPTTIWNLKNLINLDLSSNQLIGSIPSSIVNLTNIQTLYLNNNLLTDSIPSSIGNLTTLQRLALDNNNLSGNIPSSFANLTNLIGLWLESNNLTGTITDIFSNLTNLKYLNLSSNLFTGGIPASVGNLTALSYLALANNKLSGTIPDFIGNLTNLQSFYISYNQFTGSIPGTIGNLIDMQYLYLDNNQLSGNIPISIGNLTRLIFFFLNGNKLTGAIPETIGNSTTMITLDVSQNKLTGNIPAFIGNITTLKFLYLDNNKLTGSIPSTFKNLTKLQTLNLQNNLLDGSIPSLATLTNLLRINVSQNKFTFDGMELIANPSFADSSRIYSPQAIIPIVQNGNILSVSVGGTAANNVYKWYQDGSLVATKTGDSTYTIKSDAQYNVVVTNAIATSLTLYSNTITITNLPIKSIALSAKEINGLVQLQWQTMGELNTTSFTIQHSTDGKTFDDINTRAAVGIGNNIYDLIDQSPALGINYYRIKSIDKLGSISFSMTVSLRFTVNSKQLSVFPNPSIDKITINGNHIISVIIRNSTGKIVSNSQFNDALNPSITVSRFAAGTYFLHIKTRMGEEKVLSFVKQ